MDKMKVLGEAAVAVLRFLWPLCNEDFKRKVGSVITTIAAVAFAVSFVADLIAGRPLPPVPELDVVVGDVVVVPADAVEDPGADDAPFVEVADD